MKINLDISCESSAWQMIHMKCQDLFSLKKKKDNRLSSATNMCYIVRPHKIRLAQGSDKFVIIILLTA